jgi:dihydrofolate synthase/folylpolyglutamate synthase
VVKNTGLQGDGNKLRVPENHLRYRTHRHGLEVVLNQIQKTEFEQLHIVLGVVNDKDLEEIPLFPKMLFTTSQSQIIQD